MIFIQKKNLFPIQDESVAGILTVLCNHSFHSDCLMKWQDEWYAVVIFIYSFVIIVSRFYVHKIMFYDVAFINDLDKDQNICT